MTACTSLGLCEPLEGRQLLAVTVTSERFNLVSLLGYDRLGASYKYRTTATIEDSSLFGTGGTTTVSTKLAVAKKRTTYDGHASNVVSVSAVDGSSKASSAWYQDSTGTYSMAQIQGNDALTISAKLHETRVAPKYLYAGKKYEDAGTFDGSFTAEVYGEVVTGTFKGASTASAKLFGREQITVRGKSYNTVKGVYSIALNGTLKVSLYGESYSVKMKATTTQTFWAVPGIGVAKTQESMVLNVTPPGEAPETMRISGGSDLVSYVLA